MPVPPLGLSSRFSPSPSTPPSVSGPSPWLPRRGEWWAPSAVGTGRRLQDFVLEQLADLAVGAFEEGDADGNLRLSEDGQGRGLLGDLGPRRPSSLDRAVAVVRAAAEM